MTTTYSPNRRIAFLPLVYLLACTCACTPPMPEGPSNGCSGMNPGDLVISEFMADPAGSDAGKQYIELYNATPRDLGLEGVRLANSMSDRTRARTITLGFASIAPHSYFVLGDTGNDADTRPAYVNYGYGAALGSLRHESGRLAIQCGATLLDEIAYASVDSGRARELSGEYAPSASASNVDANWCSAVQALGEMPPDGQNFGTPGARNGNCSEASTNVVDSASASLTSEDAGSPPGACFDVATGVMRSPMNPRSGDLVISEIQAAPSVGNNGPGEWFEVQANADCDLNGLVSANEGLRNSTLASSQCLRVVAGERLIFARSADLAQNGGLPRVTALFDFALADASTSTTARAVILRLGSAEIDRATWTKSTKGASLQRSGTSPLGGSSAEWCTTPAEMTYGAGDRGTPGAPNTRCQPDPADAGSSMGCRKSDGSIRAPVTPEPGDLIVTEIMSSPSVGNNGPGEWFELLATAPFDLNGVEVTNEGTGHMTLSSESCISVEAGEWLLFARSNDAALNGGLPPPFATFNFTLADSASASVPERAIVLRSNGTELARARWTSSVRGRSLQLSGTPNQTDDGGASRWCPAPADATFGVGDLGTPGSENLTCN